jgi:gliding motility-associated-like protein
VGTVAGTATATDASGTVQNWAIATDGSAGALQISTAGVITVKNTSLLNALVGTDVSLSLTVSDGLNTSAPVPVIVRVVFVNQPPTLDVISNVAICKDVQTHTIQLSGASATEPGQTYTITATSTSNIFDVLSVGAGNVLSYRLKADAAAGAATVAVTIRDNGGTTGGAVDSLRRTFTITVNAPPLITITSDKGASVSKGDIVKLTATGGSTYVWTAADGIISGQRSAVLEVKPQANTSYEVTAASAAGCTATASFALSVVADFKVDAVNILTPNGDGRNDRWVIRNLDSYPDNEVKIYDRAGRLIYSRRNYSNDWDGTVNGSPLAEGTYYYILTIQNGAKTATGYITIVRDRY